MCRRKAYVACHPVITASTSEKMVARLTTMALVAVFAISHAFVAVPLQRSHASRSVAPRMLFGGGGKEGEGGGQMNMMETIKKAQQACGAPAAESPRHPASQSHDRAVDLSAPQPIGLTLVTWHLTR